jgi:putative ABC transport system permease protein
MRDLVVLALRAILQHRLRSALSMLGIAIGIASVILLTSIGEGTRRYMIAQFTQFGTNLLAINPGKSETVGVPGALGGSTRPLTIDDAESLRGLAGVVNVTPVAFGTARVEAGTRGRSVFVYGVTPNIAEVWRWGVHVGAFWPEGDPRRGAPLAVLGPKLRRELFGSENPLGRHVRIGGRDFRVLGIMESKGQFLSLDLDDAAFVPVATAMKLFNLRELQEIDVLFANASLAKEVESTVRAALIARHGDREDFTLTSQTEMLGVFGNIMNIITGAVGAIAGISLVVGAIGILTMMWIAVGERTHEIGLARAIGATRRQVQALFLVEASVLAALGGLFGLLGGLALCALLRAALPGLPVHTPAVFAAAALAVSAATGLASGVLPARRAAGLDPVDALHAE